MVWIVYFFSMRVPQLSVLLIGAAAFASATRAFAQASSESIALGDHAYEKFDATSALSNYEKAIATDPRNFEALWKASRSDIDIGSYATDPARRAKLFTSGEQYARRAVALNPSHAEGHFAVARAIGKTALSQSPKGRVKYGVEVRSQALECLKLNPRHAGCLHVMGIWNAEAMRLNGFTRLIARNLLGGQVFGTANWKDAVRYMEEAVAIDPDRIVHRVDLGGIYMDTGNRAKARAQYEAVLTLPRTDVNDPVYREQARKALASM